RRMPAVNARMTGNGDWGLGDWGVGTFLAPSPQPPVFSPEPPVPSPLAIRRGTVSHATCDRSPVATPAAKLATVSDRPLAAPRVIACTASAAARPLTSLSGLTAVNQYSGAVIATPVAATGHARDASSGSRRRNSRPI